MNADGKLSVNEVAQPNGKRVVLVVVAILGVLYLFARYYNPLANDEVLIAHFQAHREDFEELVRRYRHAYDKPSEQTTSLWFKEGDTPALYVRAGIYDVSEVSTGAPWLPNPYAKDTGRIVEDTLRKNAKVAGLYLMHKYSALAFRLSDKRYEARPPGYVSIWKKIVFFPEEPRIENGELLYPMRSDGQYSAHARVVDSLNGYPKNWKPFECVYRQIEPQWFIVMCNATGQES